MDVEDRVMRHYTHPELEARVLAALQAAGKDVERLTIDDLSALDEFHLGWRAQTESLTDRLGLRSDDRLLDIGCGIGGPARYCAAHHGCAVQGLDLTPDFVALARTLTERCGLGGRASFHQGSALAMPFAAASFDAAMLIHVGMNIADKAKLFAEARRVLKGGGRFAVYDVMAMTEAALPYPMPWAENPGTSFVATPAQYRALLATAGFRLQDERDRRAAVLQLATAMRERAAREGPPALGLHVILGHEAKERLRNVMTALEQGLIAPVEMILHAA
ncbi:class I SAM-dependent methyltransferase [Dongia sp.]|uniref:class I SAM-dependent methyltransferase n=1 Tax=Dongia sp. TaxID=1977262 RepID=UPI0035AED1B3